jgi:hypothetical protein
VPFVQVENVHVQVENRESYEGKRCSPDRLHSYLDLTFISKAQDLRLIEKVFHAFPRVLRPSASIQHSAITNVCEHTLPSSARYASSPPWSWFGFTSVEVDVLRGYEVPESKLQAVSCNPKYKER